MRAEQEKSSQSTLNHMDGQITPAGYCNLATSTSCYKNSQTVATSGAVTVRPKLSAQLHQLPELRMSGGSKPTGPLTAQMCPVHVQPHKICSVYG